MSQQTTQDVVEMICLDMVVSDCSDCPELSRTCIDLPVWPDHEKYIHIREFQQLMSW